MGVPLPGCEARIRYNDPSSMKRHPHPSLIKTKIITEFDHSIRRSLLFQNRLYDQEMPQLNNHRQTHDKMRKRHSITKT